MELAEWLKQAEQYFISQWGIDKSAAPKFALLYAYFGEYGLDPKPSSGYRSQAKQNEMLARWERGDRAGLKFKPAKVSKHTSRRAMDITTRDEKLAAQIAKALGLRAGYDFGDPVHFEA
jgi:hypothetical protein